MRYCLALISQFMFGLFKSKVPTLVNHRFKNLLISLPSNWQYSMEEGGQEAAFDPKSQSTLRINILKTTPPKAASMQEEIAALTADCPYTTTPNGYLLTNPAYAEHLEDGNNITVITWRLVNNASHEKILAVITYTVLSEEKDTVKEKEILTMIENSLNAAMLS